MRAVAHRFLVVGAGSIGRRHLGNLRAAGVADVAVCDPDPERLSAVDAEQYTDLDPALAGFRPDAALICTPPALHARQAIAAIRGGAHVLVEKPLAVSLEEVDEVAVEATRAGRVVQVGYQLQYDRGFELLKGLLEDGAIGRVLIGRVEFGQYLPDWRPWQDYRTSYTARAELGGGIILDASHEFAYLISLFGRPEAVACMAGQVSDLSVDVEDTATILLRFPDGMLADVHVDFVQRGYWRSCKLIGQRGALVWDEAAGTITVHGDESRVVEVEEDPNQPYVRELAAFARSIDTGESPAVGLELGRAVLETALRAKVASARGGVESLA